MNETGGPPTWFLLIWGAFWIVGILRMAWLLHGHPWPGRKQRMRAAARRLDLHPATGRVVFPDCFVPIFAEQGNRYWIKDRMTGVRGKSPILIADLAVEEQKNEPARYHSVAFAPMRGLPYVSVECSGLIEQLPDRLAGIAIDLESDEFNRRFRVSADLDYDVHRVLSQRVMELLMAASLADRLNMETSVGGLYLHTDGALKTERLPELLELITGIADLLVAGGFEPLDRESALPALARPKGTFFGMQAAWASSSSGGYSFLPSFFGVGQRYLRQQRFRDVVRSVRDGSWRRSPVTKRYIIYGIGGLLLGVVPIAIIWSLSMGPIGLLLALAIPVVIGLFALIAPGGHDN